MTFLITAPHPLPRHGRYVDEETGRTYARVSTILGLISKPGLQTWRETIGKDEADRIRTEAAAFGTAFHAASERLDRDGWSPEDVGDDTLTPLLAAYADWRDTHVARTLMIEEVICHDRLGYAGTVDRLVRLFGGKMALIDFKTGRGLDGTVRLQQAAYALALEACGVRVDTRLILHLPRTAAGELRVVEYDEDAADRDAWIALVKLWQWHRMHERDWLWSR